MAWFDFLGAEAIPGVTWGQILSIIVIGLVALSLERIITRYLRKFARRTRLERNVANSLILTFRVLIIIGAIASLVRVGGITTDWFVALSALGGAAVGFASSQTIGNLIAGIYLLASRPFKVGDYVRIGTVEGVVQELTINFTKILSIGNNVISIANLQILQKDITNYLYEVDAAADLYCYTFEIGFDHSVTTERIAEIFKEVFSRHYAVFPKPPNYMLVRSGAFEKVYTVYIYVEKPEMIFELRPQIAEEVFQRWDRERIKPS